ncbi:MAG TPA: OB-fold nucleic acid binding domain-containing protein [Actinomycetaceae bacterium]|nr:OB-fold nucleic acid binding domain-containing protein [Actinomycetaceae bacterium]
MRWFAKLRASRAELENADVRELLAGIEATPIAEVSPREAATVAGTVVALTFQPHGTPDSMTARLDDGTGLLGLVFLGRREVPGVEPGRRMVASGRVAEIDGLPVMYNPRYELLPGIAE